tara:strand:+ start:215 stop:1252 length:1038 start_codon:yes stop_codon:yes gene_type:complete
MKLAEVWDYTGHLESFYVKDNTALSYKTNEPYMYGHSISPQCFLQGPVYPWLWDGSYFLNLRDWDGVPPKDTSVDIVLYINERVGLQNEFYEKYRVDNIRRQFPNAVIVGQVKEIPPAFNSGHLTLPERPQNRIKFFNDCDHVNIPAPPAGSYYNTPYFNELKNQLNKELVCTPGPINVDYVFDHYYTNEKLYSIFSYTPHTHHRRGSTLDFASYIGDKYNIPVYTKPLNEETQKFDYLSSHDFVNMWKTHLYHFNLDPTDTQPGQQCKQVANVGSINIGGLNDSHHLLFPDTATCDWDKLEEVFVKYHEDENLRYQVISNAWEKLNKLFSFETVRNALKESYLK